MHIVNVEAGNVVECMKEELDTENRKREHIANENSQLFNYIEELVSYVH